MATLTREEYSQIYFDALTIAKVSKRSYKVFIRAKHIATLAEGVIGQYGKIPAESWTAKNIDEV